MNLKTVLQLLVLTMAFAITIGIVINGAKKKECHCAAERLTGEQEAYVNYKKAVSRWAYENAVEINYDAIDSLYYFPKQK